MMCSFYYYSNKILHVIVKDVYCLNLEYLGGRGGEVVFVASLYSVNLVNSFEMCKTSYIWG